MHIRETKQKEKFAHSPVERAKRSLCSVLVRTQINLNYVIYILRTRQPPTRVIYKGSLNLGPVSAKSMETDGKHDLYPKILL